MNPLSLRATNLCSYPSLDLEIPNGITAIVGLNGAGKSTLLSAIELALFADGARDLSPALGPFGERLEIELEFEHETFFYRVRRSYSGTGRGKATLDLEQRTTFSGDEGTGGYMYVPITKESASETQRFLENLLGLNRETFNASAFLAQGNSAAWTEATPAERKAILGAILDPAQLWPRLTNLALAERKVTETEIQIAQGKIEDRSILAAQVPELYRQVDQVTISKTVAEDVYAETERKLEAAQKALAANEAAVERRRAAEQARDHAARGLADATEAMALVRAEADLILPTREKLERLRGQADRIFYLESKAAEYQDARVAVDVATRNRREALEAVERQKSRCGEIEGDLSTVRTSSEAVAGRLAHLLDSKPGTERCDRCEQILGITARETAIESLRQESLDLDEQVLVKIAALDEAGSGVTGLEAIAEAIEIPDLPQAGDNTGELAAARQAVVEAASLAVTLSGYERDADRLPGLETAVRAATQAVTDADEKLEALPGVKDEQVLTLGVVNATTDRTSSRALLDLRQNDLVRAAADLDRGRQAQAELAELKGKTAKAQDQLATLRLAEKAYGRDGIPALIAENTASVIEAEANRVLERLPTTSGTVMRVQIQTQRALKTSDSLKETLDILVSDRSTTREFATYSGGERFRVSFALRWALAKLLANRRGAESRLLVIDEPDGLDAGGMDGLAAVLREEVSTFEKILIVSHNPLLASAFLQVISVESDGDVSRLVMA